MERLVPPGARLRVTRELRTHGLSTWHAPFTGDFETTIPVGTILVTENGQRDGAPGFSAVLEDYERLGAELVPDGMRLAERYSGYYFVFLASDVGDGLELML